MRKNLGLFLVFCFLFSGVVTCFENVSGDLELFKRGGDFNVYKNLTSGSNVLKVHVIPINYDNGIEYSPINTTIVEEGCEYDYCVRKGVYYADFKQNSLEDDLVKFYYNGSYVSYTPLSLKYVNDDGFEVISDVREVNGYADGSEFVYFNFYGEGLDLGYEYRNAFLKENLVISNRSVLPYSNLSGDVFLSLDFELESEVAEREEESFWSEKKKISRNLANDYFNWIESSEDSQPGNFNIQKFYLIYGVNGFGFNNDNDYIVTENDSLKILDNINASSNKAGASFLLRHSDLPEDEKVKEIIKEVLN